MRKITRVALSGALLLAITFFPHPLAPGRIIAYSWLWYRTERRIENADPEELLEGCRVMIANRDAYRRLGQDRDDGLLILELPSTGDSITPDVVRALGPMRVQLEEDSVTLVFFGGFNHLGLRAYAPSAEVHESSSDSELCEGLWLISD